MCGNNSCLWIILILILVCCCGCGNNGNTRGLNGCCCDQLNAYLAGFMSGYPAKQALPKEHLMGKEVQVWAVLVTVLAVTTACGSS